MFDVFDENKTLSGSGATTTGQCGARGTAAINVTNNVGSGSIVEQRLALSLVATFDGGGPGGAVVVCNWTPFPAAAVIVDVNGSASSGGTVGTYPQASQYEHVNYTGSGYDVLGVASPEVHVPSTEHWFRFRVTPTQDGIDSSADGTTWTTLITDPPAVPSGFTANTSAGGGNQGGYSAEIVLNGAIYFCP